MKEMLELPVERSWDRHTETSLTSGEDGSPLLGLNNISWQQISKFILPAELFFHPVATAVELEYPSEMGDD